MPSSPQTRRLLNPDFCLTSLSFRWRDLENFSATFKEVTFSFSQSNRFDPTSRAIPRATVFDSSFLQSALKSDRSADQSSTITRQSRLTSYFTENTPQQLRPIQDNPVSGLTGTEPIQCRVHLIHWKVFCNWRDTVASREIQHGRNGCGTANR